MKNIKYLLLLVIAIFAMTSTVDAATITKASYDGNFKIEGTGTGRVQIALFGLDDSPLYMTTTTVTNGKFSITLPDIEGLKKGEYTIKVADYDGTNANTKIVKVTTNDDKSNPKTYDGILWLIILGGISLIALLGLGIRQYSKKKS